MNKHLRLTTIVTILLLTSLGAYAGVFARGGGESRRITAVSPPTTYNNGRQSVTLSGNFSSKQGDRRIAVSGPQLLGAVPVTVNHWSGHSISVTLPAHLNPGRYQLFLQRSYRDHGRSQWRTISDTGLLTVRGGAEPVNRDGSPHAVQIRRSSQESVCAGQPIHIRVSGHAFQRDRRAYQIHAEARANNVPINAVTPPTVRILSATQADVSVARCFVLRPGAEIRLVYPDRSHSNWLSVEQHPGRVSEQRGTQPRRLQPAR